MSNSLGEHSDAYATVLFLTHMRHSKRRKGCHNDKNIVSLMGKYEVTYGLWSEVKNWATTSGGYTFANAGQMG